MPQIGLHYLSSGLQLAEVARYTEGRIHIRVRIQGSSGCVSVGFHCYCCWMFCWSGVCSKRRRRCAGEKRHTWYHSLCQARIEPTHTRRLYSGLAHHHAIPRQEVDLSGSQKMRLEKGFMDQQPIEGCLIQPLQCPITTPLLCPTR
jgi:hypothetical protein